MLIYPRHWLFIGLSLAAAVAQKATATEVLPTHTAQTTSVEQLSDVQSTDWAYQALQTLIDTYGSFADDLDKIGQSGSTLSRHEFADVLNTLLEALDPLIAEGQVTAAELETVARLQAGFSTELAALSSSIDSMETRATTLEDTLFSTTTVLKGQAIFAINAGDFGGDEIIAPRGALISDRNPNPTALHRVSLNLNTSFTGTDLLQLRLLTGSSDATDNTTGLLEPNFASGLHFSQQGRNNSVGIARAYYQFLATPDLAVTVGATMTATDIIDKNRYANNSALDFSSQAFVNNFVLIPRNRGTGGALDWSPAAGPVSLRAVYIAGDASGSFPENRSAVGGGGPDDIAIFPSAGEEEKGGLFGDPNQAIVELEYAMDDRLALRLQYSTGRVIDSDFDVFGLNAEWAVSDRIGLFGRYGYGSYIDTNIGDISPQYWSAGVAFQDLFLDQARAGLAVGQPFVETSVGDATQTNYEVFYNFPVTDYLRITPLVQVVTDPGNQKSNGAIAAFTIRSVFSF